jgi:hypothetical protein
VCGPGSCGDAREARSERRSTTMAVRAHHIASVDLVENGLPVVTADPDRDAEALASYVVELEHQRVGLSAVEAWPLAEELDQIGHPLGNQHAFFDATRSRHTVAVGRVVLWFVLGSTRAAVVVALAFSPAVPGKLL